jgi:hypothetical protein
MGISREEYLKLSDLCPTIDPNKAEVFEVVLFFCDFIESKILPVNSYANWNKYPEDKTQLLEFMDLTRHYIAKQIDFEILKNWKIKISKSVDNESDPILSYVWQMVWPFTFDFLNDDEIESTEWFENMNCNIPHISINLWYDFVDMVKERFKGRFLE